MTAYLALPGCWWKYLESFPKSPFKPIFLSPVFPEPLAPISPLTKTVFPSTFFLPSFYPTLPPSLSVSWVYLFFYLTCRCPQINNKGC